MLVLGALCYLCVEALVFCFNFVFCVESCPLKGGLRMAMYSPKYGARTHLGASLQALQFQHDFYCGDVRA